MEGVWEAGGAVNMGRELSWRANYNNRQVWRGVGRGVGRSVVAV